MNGKDPTKPQIIIGDTNNGPAIPSVGFTGKFASNYQLLTDDGYVDANV